MKQSNACLVGSDMELFGIEEHLMDDLPRWLAWIEKLDNIPPKGQRKDLGDGFWAHRDGLAAEYGFEPTTILEQFLDRLHTGKVLLEAELRHNLRAVTSFNVRAIRNEWWAADCLEIGCQPDFLAHPIKGMVQRQVPRSVRYADTRECGGHIHMSLPPPFLESDELKSQFILELDSMVYPIASGTRELHDYRTWYRRRAVFRPTSYGVEYRTLGAADMFSEAAPVFMGMVFDLVKSAWEG